MATVDERVKKIIAEQLGVEEDEVTPEAQFRRRPRGRFARYG